MTQFPEDTVDLRSYKSSTTSQHGEDGIIASIFEVIGTTTKRCVEFGAYALTEDSNVHDLWREKGWSALLIEGEARRAKAIVEAYQAICASAKPPAGTVSVINAFVGTSGTNSLDAILDRQGWKSDIDLCIIDVDSTDYHIFASLRAQPRVIVCEFNPTIPVHLSIVGSIDGNYMGCSARALADLGKSKGYSLVACTKVNCIFVRNDLAAPFKHRDELELMFDPFAINFAMSAYDGSTFFSREPLYHSNLFSQRVASDLGSHAGDYWIPAKNLSTAYITSRLFFTLLNRFLPGAASAAMSAFRSIRRAFKHTT